MKRPDNAITNLAIFADGYSVIATQISQLLDYLSSLEANIKESQDRPASDGFIHERNCSIWNGHQCCDCLTRKQFDDLEKRKTPPSHRELG